jgi:hypothetical protein
VIAGVIGYFVGFRMVTDWLNPAGSASNVPEPVVAPGWKRHESRAHGFSIQLPVEYTGIDPADPKLKEIIAQTANEHPEARAVLMQAVGNASFVFWAFNFKQIEGGFSRNLNVIRSNRSATFPSNDAELETYRQSMAALAPTSGKLISVNLVKLPAGAAIFSQLELNLQGAQGTQSTYSASYYLRSEKSDLTFTFTSLAKDADAFAPIAEKAIQTLRFTD